LTSTGDAFEGTIIAPLLTNTPYTLDAIPRLILSILIPGGIGELCIFQPDGSGHRGSETDKSDRHDDRNNCIGIIRLQTENLGSLNVKLDFKESLETGTQPRVSGVFNVDQSVVDPLRSELPSLDRALEARGIQPDGFNVRGIMATQQTVDSPGKVRQVDFTGGLDVKA
jgi:hypothetical protein